MVVLPAEQQNGDQHEAASDTQHDERRIQTTDLRTAGTLAARLDALEARVRTVDKLTAAIGKQLRSLRQKIGALGRESAKRGEPRPSLMPQICASSISSQIVGPWVRA